MYYKALRDIDLGDVVGVAVVTAKDTLCFYKHLHDMPVDVRRTVVIKGERISETSQAPLFNYLQRKPAVVSFLTGLHFIEYIEPYDKPRKFIKNNTSNSHNHCTNWTEEQNELFTYLWEVSLDNMARIFGRTYSSITSHYTELRAKGWNPYKSPKHGK